MSCHGLGRRTVKGPLGLPQVCMRGVGDGSTFAVHANLCRSTSTDRFPERRQTRQRSWPRCAGGGGVDGGILGKENGQHAVQGAHAFWLT